MPSSSRSSSSASSWRVQPAGAGGVGTGWQRGPIMAHNLADLGCHVPPGSGAAGVAISRARWRDEGDSHYAQRSVPPGSSTMEGYVLDREAPDRCRLVDARQRPGDRPDRDGDDLADAAGDLAGRADHAPG